MILNGLPFLIVRSNLPAGGIDQDVDRFWKGRPVLDVMVGDQAEDFALGKDGCILVERTIAKMERYARGDAVSVNNLDDVANGDGGAFCCLNNKEPMRCALGKANRNRFRMKPGESESAKESGEKNGLRWAAEKRVHESVYLE